MPTTGAAAKRADGSWSIQYRRGCDRDHNSDSNFCAWHRHRGGITCWSPVTAGSASEMADRPRGYRFRPDLQATTGETYWA